MQLDIGEAQGLGRREKGLRGRRQLTHVTHLHVRRRHEHRPAGVVGDVLVEHLLVQHVLLASVSGQQRVNLTRRQHGRIVPAVDALDAIAEVARVSVGRMPSLKAREVGRGNSAVTLGRQGILLALGARVTVSLAVATSTA